jgi:hypothetical protein
VCDVDCSVNKRKTLTLYTPTNPHLYSSVLISVGFSADTLTNNTGKKTPTTATKTSTDSTTITTIIKRNELIWDEIKII